MTRLEELLHDAAEGPVRFDHRDVARRRRRRRHRRLVAAAVVGVLGVVGVVGGLGDDEQLVDSTGPVEDGAVTVEELTAERWVALAYSAVMVAPTPPAFVQLADDGRLVGFDGCRPIRGDWALDGTRLVTSLEPMGNVACENQTGGLTELLDADPELGRFGDGTDLVQLTAGEDFVAFERFDRLGDEPNPTVLAGTWTPGTSGRADEGPATVAFEADGTGRVSLRDCAQPFDWSVDGDILSVEGLDPDGVTCDGGVASGGLLQALTGSPRLRVDDSALWISSDLGIDLLRSAAGDTDPTPTTTTTLEDELAAREALERAAGAVRFITAAADGVTRHEGDRSTRISDGPAAIAFAVGADIVVSQPASTTSASYPPIADGTPVVWVAGERRELLVDPGARSAVLLDTAVLDGVPVALLAESHGGVGPDDTFEELVAIDLETMNRTTVVRRPAWESGHFEARLLPDGDVVGLFASESIVLLARWRPGQDSAVWTIEVASDSRPTLTMLDGQLGVVSAGFSEAFEPVLRIRRFGLDGAEQGEETVTIADPSDQLGAGLFCTDWYDAAHLVCGRSDGPPIMVSLAVLAFEQLAAGDGGYPTVLRTG